jgi:hypothetical protein
MTFSAIGLSFANGNDNYRDYPDSETELAQCQAGTARSTQGCGKLAFETGSDILLGHDAY